MHRWIVKLVAFDFEVQFRKGRENGAADRLFRAELEQPQQLITTVQVLAAIFEWIKLCQATAPSAIKITEQLSSQNCHCYGYMLRGG